jgi:tetratricopeptide (TPR) repeat protein
VRRLAAVLLLLAAGSLACARRGVGRPAAGSPVVLISIDTLRADHLPIYGYEKVEAPAISSLRRDSILYGNAVSHVPLTLPSHTTILTGLLPPQNGVRDNTGYVVAPTLETLAGVLRKRGYATGAAISAVVLVGSSGISRGFDFYDDNFESLEPDQSLGVTRRSGYRTEEISEEWIRRRGTGPFFFFLHLYEPHTPYEPPEPFKSRYKEAPYDGEIATADDIVGRFLSFLKAEKVYDRALIVFLSDHGEGLGEHGEDGHGILLYREALHVPLLVKLPGSSRGGETVTRPVGLVDVFPTVLETLGISLPSGSGHALPGISLLRDDRAAALDRRLYSETLYPRYHYGWSDLCGLTDAQYQYIHGTADEFYNFRADAAEKNDLAAGLPAPFRSMRNALLTMDRPRQAPGASDPEQVKKLASLGYLGSTSAPETAKNLPNPRDHVGEIRELKAAVALAGRPEETLSRLRSIVRRNPSMVDAWWQIADLLHRTGRNAEAVEVLMRLDRLTPGSNFVFDALATDFLEMGDRERAELYARRAVSVADTPTTRTTLARVLLAKKDLDGAENEAKRALVGHEGRRLPTFMLALISRGRGDDAGALALLDRLAKNSREPGELPLINVEYERGDILARMGRSAEAEAAFRAEIERFPVNLVAWRSLAVLLADGGREAEARRTIEDMVKSSGNPRAPEVARQTLMWLTNGRAASPRENGAR